MDDEEKRLREEWEREEEKVCLRGDICFTPAVREEIADADGASSIMDLLKNLQQEGGGLTVGPGSGDEMEKASIKKMFESISVFKAGIIERFRQHIEDEYEKTKSAVLGRLRDRDWSVKCDECSRHVHANKTMHSQAVKVELICPNRKCGAVVDKPWLPTKDPLFFHRTAEACVNSLFQELRRYPLPGGSQAIETVDGRHIEERLSSELELLYLATRSGEYTIEHPDYGDLTFNRACLDGMSGFRAVGLEVSSDISRELQRLHTEGGWNDPLDSYDLVGAQLAYILQESGIIRYDKSRTGGRRKTSMKGPANMLLLSDEYADEVEKRFTLPLIQDDSYEPVNALIDLAASENNRIMLVEPLEHLHGAADIKQEAEEWLPKIEALRDEVARAKESNKRSEVTAAKKELDKFHKQHGGAMNRWRRWKDPDQLDILLGGYLLPPVRRKKGVVSNHWAYQRVTDDKERCRPSEKAVRALNHLQKTPWAINEDVLKVARDVVPKLISEEYRKLQWESPENPAQVDGVWQWREKKFDSEVQALEFHNGLQPRIKLAPQEDSDRPREPTWGMEDWNEFQSSLQKAQDIVDGWGQGFSNRFWHVWRFDWRGRMITASPILSPQADDLDRGLLLFADEHPLTTDGLRWLKIRLASLWDGHGGWKNMTSDDALPTFAELESACDEEENIALLRRVAANSRDEMDEWCSGALKAKSEAFQRLAATLEFVRILKLLDNPETTADDVLTRLPISQDASTNVYQHVSALIRDVNMARKVNVLPKVGADGKPVKADFYAEVVRELNRKWDEDNPLENIDGLTSEEAQSIKDVVVERSISKKPVMTLSYGATTKGIKDSLLTHNGKTNGKKSWGKRKSPPEDTWEKPKPESPPDGESAWIWNGAKYVKENYVYCHPASILGEVLNKKNVDEEKHSEIVRIVAEGYEEALNEVAPKFMEMKNTLRKFNSDNGKEQIIWTTSAGFKVFSSKLRDPETQKVSRIDVSENRRVRLKEGIQGLAENVKSGAGDGLFKGFNTVSKKLRELLKLAKDDEESMATHLEMIVEDEEGPRRELAIGVLDYWNEKPWTTISCVRHSGETDHAKEKRGRPPNFVHSLDAAHMQLVLLDFEKFSENDNSALCFWSVHDSFGCHPSMMGQLRTSVITRFCDVHAETEEGGIELFGPLDALHHHREGKGMDDLDKTFSTELITTENKGIDHYFIS